MPLQQLVDYGTLQRAGDRVLFVFGDRPDISIRVEDAAQGVHELLTPLVGHPVSVLWTQLPSNVQAGVSVAMLIHKVIPHTAIRERAFEISASPEGRNAEENWLRAERELLATGSEASGSAKRKGMARALNGGYSMKASVEQIAIPQIANPMRVLIIEPGENAAGAPVLIYLHGAREASLHENELPLVCNHLSPPFQAILGRLTEVSVVAPQAPHDRKGGWDWQVHVRALGEYLAKRFPQRKILATGFSRGGLGVLQLLRECPDLISKWAIVDPERAGDAKAEGLLPPSSPDDRGWLRYGEDYPDNTRFSVRLSSRLSDSNAKFVKLHHGELALAAYKGEQLGGPESLYEFLGLNYR